MKKYFYTFFFITIVIFNGYSQNSAINITGFDYDFGDKGGCLSNYYYPNNGGAAFGGGNMKNYQVVNENDEIFYKLISNDNSIDSTFVPFLFDIYYSNPFECVSMRSDQVFIDMSNHSSVTITARGTPGSSIRFYLGSSTGGFPITTYSFNDQKYILFDFKVSSVWQDYTFDFNTSSEWANFTANDSINMFGFTAEDPFSEYDIKEIKFGSAVTSPITSTPIRLNNFKYDFNFNGTCLGSSDIQNVGNIFPSTNLQTVVYSQNTYHPIQFHSPTSIDSTIEPAFFDLLFGKHDLTYDYCSTFRTNPVFIDMKKNSKVSITAKGTPGSSFKFYVGYSDGGKPKPGQTTYLINDQDSSQTIAFKVTLTDTLTKTFLFNYSDNSYWENFQFNDSINIFGIQPLTPNANIQIQSIHFGIIDSVEQTTEPTIKYKNFIMDYGSFGGCLGYASPSTGGYSYTSPNISTAEAVTVSGESYLQIHSDQIIDESFVLPGYFDIYYSHKGLCQSMRTTKASIDLSTSPTVTILAKGTEGAIMKFYLAYSNSTEPLPGASTFLIDSNNGPNRINYPIVLTSEWKEYSFDFSMDPLWKSFNLDTSVTMFGILPLTKDADYLIKEINFGSGDPPMLNTYSLLFSNLGNCISNGSVTNGGVINTTSNITSANFISNQSFTFLEVKANSSIQNADTTWFDILYSKTDSLNTICTSLRDEFGQLDLSGTTEVTITAKGTSDAVVKFYIGYSPTNASSNAKLATSESITGIGQTFILNSEWKDYNINLNQLPEWNNYIYKNQINVYGLTLLTEGAQMDVKKVDFGNLKVTGIVDRDAKIDMDIIVYPNPAMQLVTIDVSSIPGQKQIELISSEGISVLHTNVINQTSIELENFPKGLYLIKVAQDNKITTKRLIIN